MFRVSAKVRDFYLSEEFFRMDYGDVLEPLLRSFDPDKGVPLDIDRPIDYFASTTTTTLLALYHIKVLDATLLRAFHETLFKLRDSTVNRIVKQKFPEDAVAWDVSESASVWATSLAIWALLGTRYNGDRMDEIKDAVLWLIDQQKPGGGWGFDIRCESRVFFTAQTLHAIKLAISALEFTEREGYRLKKSIEDGVQFLLEKCKRKGKITYWSSAEGEKDGDPTSTLCAIWALFEHDQDKYHDLIIGGLEFLRIELRGRELWEFKQVITEIDTKYTTHKAIISYTPSFPILLLRLGVNPFDEICLKPIIWLRKNRVKNGWNFPGLSNNALSFTTAYSLWTINQWHRYAVKYLVGQLEVYPTTLRLLRKRITVLSLIILSALLIIIIKFTPIIGISLSFFSSTTRRYGTHISILASILAILGFSGLIPALRYIDTRLLNGKIVGTFKKLKTVIEWLLYLK